MASPAAIEVSAGLLFREGRLLIAQRLPEAHLGGLWEFPGGKRESGETFEVALQRELLEELGVEVDVLEQIESVDHTYPTKRVCIQFFRCRLRSGKPQPLGCHALKWVTREALSEHAFPEADARLLSRLLNEAALWAL